MKSALIIFLFAASIPASGFALGSSAFGQGLDLPSVKQAAADIAVPLPSAAVPAAADPAAPAQKKEWTVMVFMNGSNNLADWSFNDIREMSAVGTTDNINVTMEMGLKMDATSMAQRMLVLPGDGKEIGGVVYKTWQNRDMGDWRNAADFVKWSKARFPARRYLLIMQDHGGGFVDETFKPKKGNKGISYDEITRNYIKVPELPLMLKETGTVDMLIFNACEMQMAEVAYEIGVNAGVIIASEEVDRASYFQYKERLKRLNARPQEPTEAIAAAFVDMRRQMLTPGNQIYSEVTGATYTIRSDSVGTLSAVRTAELKNLPALLDAWVGAVMAANEPQTVLYAVASSVRFGVLKPSEQPFSQFTDLWDFVGRVSAYSKKQEVKAASAELFDFIDRKLIIANAAVNVNASGVDYSKTLRGIAIKMIPLTPVNHSVLYPSHSLIVDTRYADLQFSKASRWDEFLAWAGKIYYQAR